MQGVNPVECQNLRSRLQCENEGVGGISEKVKRRFYGQEDPQRGVRNTGEVSEKGSEM